MLFDNTLIYNQVPSVCVICVWFVCDAWQSNSKMYRELQSSNNCLYFNEEEKYHETWLPDTKLY